MPSKMTATPLFCVTWEGGLQDNLRSAPLLLKKRCGLARLSSLHYKNKTTITSSIKGYLRIQQLLCSQKQNSQCPSNVDVLSVLQSNEELQVEVA
ncbi:hypothetical protein AOXY_G37752 [Acipenser oxyrinchus oxyrinchus]|uniref:Uncharacterized protein n=1 Tax=Acipenser oxyrinchus oxyrinchus TaxID=40147 RepID=A0AAD8FNS6_ACIOX|nr:hypothetical protein AOXY_G37752 [Acipenser oxyrinchus oxyrinchus]